MSQVTNCPTCGAVCRVVGRDPEGATTLQAFQNTDAQKKIEQLKQSLHQLQETLQTERATAKAKISDLETELATLRTAVPSELRKALIAVKLPHG